MQVSALQRDFLSGLQPSKTVRDREAKAGSRSRAEARYIRTGMHLPPGKPGGKKARAKDALNSHLASSKQDERPLTSVSGI